MSILSMYERVLHADVSGVALVTPLQEAPIISQRLSNTIYMKREDLQSVFSFKCRGAYNKIRQLSNHEKSRGIIAASAGNHAQGVALSAQTLGLTATIIMPQTTPPIKVKAVERLGAAVILHGDSYDDAYARAMEESNRTGMVFIHPYDDDDVIAGQGTIATEILDQLSEPIDYVFVAVGGGGLLAGITAVFKSVSPTTSIIAVEPNNSNCLQQALDANERVVLDTVGIFVDGVAVKQIGERPFELVKDHVDDSISVSVDDICAAINDIYNETRTIVEPAGALSLAGAKSYIRSKSLTNKNIVTINCGANMNFDRLRHIAERTQISDNNELLMAVHIPETPGALMSFCQIIGKRTITEFNYRYQSDAKATIFVGLENNESLPDVIESLQINGYQFYDFSSNECAIIHIRHMIGGIPQQPIKNERIFRFQFPERPGALNEFLSALKNRWNISMFHYRNHGAAFGRVLVGFNVTDGSDNELIKRLNQTGFYYTEETNNPAIDMFLKA